MICLLHLSLLEMAFCAETVGLDRALCGGQEVQGLWWGAGRQVMPYANEPVCSWLFMSVLGRVMSLPTACPLWISSHR